MEPVAVVRATGVCIIFTKISIYVTVCLMSINERLDHHHVVEGISLAHNGRLPEDFVVPTAEALLDGSAAAYGWEWWCGYMAYASGRPVSEMPPKRRAATFGDIDIEGNQVVGPKREVGDPNEYGIRQKRQIEGRTDLMEIFSTPEPLVIPHAYQFGCFSQNTGYVNHNYTALALVPAERQTHKAWDRLGPYTIDSFSPSSFDGADHTIKGGKWRRYGFALLPQPGFIVEDPDIYKC